MQQLNLPSYHFKIKSLNQKQLIFDSIRKKYVVLTPEEWVRQHFIQYLIKEKGFPESLIIVEKSLLLNRMGKRSDIVIYNTFGQAVMIVECKSNKISVTQETFEQIARYNMVLKVNYLTVTNGMTHYCCKMDYTKNSYTFLNDIPDYNKL